MTAKAATNAEISDLITKSGLSTREIKARVNTASHGTTKRPQNFTITWVAFALGYERKWIKLQ